jgi:hypothetical protein
MKDGKFVVLYFFPGLKPEKRKFRTFLFHPLLTSPL